MNGTGLGVFPYAYTVPGLSNGVGYYLAVRAEDSASPVHEDTNAVVLLAVPGTNGRGREFPRLPSMEIFRIGPAFLGPGRGRLTATR